MRRAGPSAWAALGAAHRLATSRYISLYLAMSRFVSAYLGFLGKKMRA